MIHVGILDFGFLFDHHDRGQTIEQFLSFGFRFACIRRVRFMFTMVKYVVSGQI